MTNFQKQYYDFWTKLYNFKNRIKLIDVDFDQPWWVIIWKQKYLFLMLLSSIALSAFFDAWIIVWLVMAMQNLDSTWLLTIISLRILCSLIFVYIFQWNPIFQLTTTDSVSYSAARKALTTDPIHHTTKSSGIILSKISKGSIAYENLLDVITFEIFGMIIGSISTIVLLFGYNFKLGLISGFCFGLLAVLSVFSNIWNNKVFKPASIVAEDAVSQASFETLNQAFLIRSVYATDSQLSKLKDKTYIHLGKLATLWRVDSMGYVFVRILFFAAAGLIGTIIIDEIKGGRMTVAVGIAIITSFVIASKEVQNIGNNVKKYSENLTRIKDLFTYMRAFGKQTYPVVEGDKKTTFEDGN